MSTQSEPPSRKVSSALNWFGSFLFVLGMTLTGAFLSRQFKEAGSGHTYYEFIAGGVLLAIIGLAVIIGARRKSQ